jgi:ABC-type phosphate transport system permease subunit
VVFLPEAASVFAKTSSRQQTRRLLTAGLVLLLLLLLLLPFERTCTRTQEAD